MFDRVLNTSLKVLATLLTLNIFKTLLHVHQVVDPFSYETKYSRVDRDMGIWSA